MKELKFFLDELNMQLEKIMRESQTPNIIFGIIMHIK